MSNQNENEVSLSQTRENVEGQEVNEVFSSSSFQNDTVQRFFDNSVPSSSQNFQPTEPKVDVGAQFGTNNLIIRRKNYKGPKEKTKPNNNAEILKKEIEKFSGKKIFGCVGLPSKNRPNNWELIFEGPPQSPYSGGIFFGNIEFPPSYPDICPAVKFSTCIFHPNISARGKLDMRKLRKDWVPEFNVTNVFEFISREMLTIKPNGPSCSQPKLGALFYSDLDHFNELIKKTTRKYATIPNVQQEENE